MTVSAYSTDFPIELWRPERPNEVTMSGMSHAAIITSLHGRSGKTLLARTLVDYFLLSGGRLKPLDTASAQEPTPQELKPLDSVHPKPKKLSRAPVTKPPSLPKPMSVVAPGNATILGGSLATELASCDKGTERSEPLRLPGAKGEIKLDRCYRGRDHLVCSFHALLREAKALFNDYGKIVQADYPNLDNVAAVCSLQLDDLAANLKNASAFNARFKILKSEYALRAACASKFEQSLRDVMLPDMAHGQDILKSLVDSLQADIKDVIAVQKEVSDLANKIEASQKAMTTIRTFIRAYVRGTSPCHVVLMTRLPEHRERLKRTEPHTTITGKPSRRWHRATVVTAQRAVLAAEEP
jgi:hypothetical protein